MRNKLTAAASLLLVSLAPAAEAANLPVYTSYQFSESSPLATGRWVRISVGESGVYEITYSQLRKMGFSDPSAVAIYGQPGTQRPINMMHNNGSRLVEDNIKPVRIMHSNNKILFYGEGPEKINFNVTGYNTTLTAQHVRESKNVYSDRAYYFLTDTHPAETMPSHKVDLKDSAKEITSGYAYLYHEKDLEQGDFLAGQTFWGERLKAGSPVSFKISAPYVMTNNKCTIITDVAIRKDQTGDLTVKLGGARVWTLKRSENKIFSFENTLSTLKLSVDENQRGTGTLSLTVTGGYPTSQTLALDYWTLTYPMSIKYARDDSNFTQQYIGFRSTIYKVWKHPVPAGSTAWDITDHKAPEILDTDNDFLYHDYNGRCEAIVFNPSKQQKQIGDDFTTIPNQDLHALGSEGADMLIFTTAEMEPYARRIADLHTRHLGQKVVTVTQQEVYNEFSSGTPDPMAYRLLAKMLFQSEERPLKNILIIGPVYGDYRDVRRSGRTSEGHIAYQQPKTDISKMPDCVMDYYGVMSDRVTYPNNLENAPISVGVGILPINSSEEGELAVAKIKEYIEKQDFSGLVNETMTIACQGDAYLHDNQAIRLGSLFQTLAAADDSEFAHRTIWIEGLGSDKANSQIHDALGAGKLFTTYFGHAGSGGMDGFSVKDVVASDNPELGFMFFAACDLCRPDNCEHGIGDMAVIRSKRGFIGSICATRTVLSNYNDNLARNFVNSLFIDNDNNRRTATPTIGEVYARSKECSINESEIDYMLIGDPGLPVPVALGKIELTVPDREYCPGETVEVKGRVTGSGESTLTDYNGFVTLKLMAPTRSIPVLMGTDINGTPVVIRDEIPYNDFRLLTVKAEVKDGEFTARMPMPAECSAYMPSTGSTASLPIMAGAYDPTSRLGTSGITSVALAETGSKPGEDADRDDTAPVATLTFDAGLQTLTISASDDTAMLPGVGQGAGIYLNIDGKPINVAHEYSTGTTVPSYSTAIGVARLGTGLHTATYYATDIAGNKSQPQVLKFAIAERSPLRLTADRPTAIDTIEFTIAGNGEFPLRLVVCDRDGNIVAENDTDSASATYDTSGLAPGTYRAAVRCDSALGARVYSNWVEFTVID